MAGPIHSSGSTSPVTNGAQNLTGSKTQSGSLGSSKVTVAPPERSFFSKIKDFFSSSRPADKSIHSRKVSLPPVEPRSTKAASDGQKVALERLKGNAEARSRFQALDKSLQAMTEAKGKLNSEPRHSTGRNEARMELQIAKEKLALEVKAFNTSAMSSGLEPLNAGDLESAMMYGGMEGFDDDAACLKQYESIKNALTP